MPFDLENGISNLNLAYWFMDDGSNKWKNKVLSIRFCTDSYSELEINLLINILKNKFDLNVTKTISKNKWRLYIGTGDYDKVKKLIYPHLIPSMLYKFPI